MKRFKTLVIAVVSTVILFLGGLFAWSKYAATRPTSDFAAEVAVSWFDLELQFIRDTSGFTPPVASRALGYLGVTVYEAVVNGMPEYQSLAGELNGMPAMPQIDKGKQYSWPLVANSALAEVTRSLFSHTANTNKEKIAALENRLRQQIDVKQTVAARSEEYGKRVAAAILEWESKDGGHEAELRNFPTDYVPPAGDAYWIPTPPLHLKAMLPDWGNTRTFVAASENCQVPPPLAFSKEPGSPFYEQGREVYETVKNNTDEHRNIALFWADDPGSTYTPPGHWVFILNQFVQEHDIPLDKAAEAYARVGISVADAFIECWKVKYTHNVVRPITYIQKHIDKTWNQAGISDPVITPAFPEYPSGHSTQSAAAASVLTELFGDNVAFTDHANDWRFYESRSFSSFNEAAEEAALSRLYGGIHYKSAIENGLTQGRCIGDAVNAVDFRKK